MTMIELWELDQLQYERKQRILKEQRQAFKDARPRISKTKLTPNYYVCSSQHNDIIAVGYGVSAEDAYAKWWVNYQYRIKTNELLKQEPPKKKWYQLWKLF